VPRGPFGNEAPDRSDQKTNHNARNQPDQYRSNLLGVRDSVVVKPKVCKRADDITGHKLNRLHPSRLTIHSCLVNRLLGQRSDCLLGLQLLAEILQLHRIDIFLVLCFHNLVVQFSNRRIASLNLEGEDFFYLFDLPFFGGTR